MSDTLHSPEHRAQSEAHRGGRQLCRSSRPVLRRAQEFTMGRGGGASGGGGGGGGDGDGGGGGGVVVAAVVPKIPCHHTYFQPPRTHRRTSATISASLSDDASMRLTARPDFPALAVLPTR